MIQSVFTPTELCSTTLGQSLLSWYFIIENHYCFSTANGAWLPRVWRSGIVRANEGRLHPILPGVEHKAALLNLLWQEYDDLIMGYFAVLAGLRALTILTGDERLRTETHLSSQLVLFYRELQQFTESPRMLEILQPAETVELEQSTYVHSSCCPKPPFAPACYEFPPVGTLRLVCHCVEVMITAFIKPVLKPVTKYTTPLERDVAEYHVYDMCRAFAGIELMYSHDPDFLLPCYSALSVAACYCPKPIRRWLWSKLKHWELVCPTSVAPIRKTLAVFWRIPELAEEGFQAWNEEPPDGKNWERNAEDIALASGVEELTLEDM
jgi:hypothetical protein